MTMTRQTASHPIPSRRDLRDLVYDIVYARVLLAVDGGDARQRDLPLRLALRDALEQVASTEDERRRIANEALEAAWARLASELGIEPEGPVASAA
jgi:hypothetical protein